MTLRGLAAMAVLVPSAVLFVILFALHRPLLALLYDSSFEAPAGAVALLFTGSLVRIGSWIALFALYAAVRTRAISIAAAVRRPGARQRRCAHAGARRLVLVGRLCRLHRIQLLGALRTGSTNRFAMTMVAARK